jgi:hypothetical protein
MRQARGHAAAACGAKGLMAAVMMSCGALVLAVTAVASPTSSCPNAQLRTGASIGLPDCRAYEQVSPIEKGGFTAYPTQATPAQVASGADNSTGIGYLSFEAFPGALGNSALYAAHVSTRTPEGWQTQELTPAVPEARVLRIYQVSYAFSDDLSDAVLQVPMVALTPDATPGVYNLFLRRPHQTPLSPLGFEYSLVNAAAPALSAEELCPPSLVSLCYLFADVSAFAGASGDFSHVLFESNAQLTPEAPETFIESLYEASDGQVHLVGILPDGSPASSSTAGAGSSIEYISGEPEKDLRLENAISRDGSHIVFQALADGGAPDAAQVGRTEIYDRINGEETIEISAPALGAKPGVATPESATFAGASQDGSRVFFTSSAELTTQSNTGSANNSEDLYEYNLTNKALTDLSVDTNPEDATTGAMVQGVVDESADGQYVYFVARGQLNPSKGTDGQPNLYMVHNGAAPVFIATLGNGTCNFRVSESGDSCVWSPYPAVREAYVTPDGRHMAFMSTASIPTANFPGGYDNIDQTTGETDSEVYEYTAPTASEEEGAGAGRLVCGSCDPTGEAPIGSALIGGISVALGGAKEGRQTYSGISTPFYRARALSDNGGRLFYTSPVPHVGPKELLGPFERVQEYEQQGEGGCTTVDACQETISSPDSDALDQFLGASADGTDIYFVTTSRLSDGDIDNLRDVYDARVDGGLTSPSPVPTCESACRALAPFVSNAPSVLGAVSGPSGNLPSAPPKRPVKKCAKGRKLSHGRCVKTKKNAKRATVRKATHASSTRRAR